MPNPYGKKVDKVTAITIFGLALFGLAMIYSSSVIVGYLLFGDDKHFFKRQIIWLILGFIGMIIASNIDYRNWQKWAGAMLGVTFVLLISVFFFSVGEINGAHRWISFGGQTFQPSELAKLTFILYLSGWLVQRQNSLADIQKTFIPFLAVLFAISFLMLKQPDFGTLSIILVAAISIYFVAGLTWKQIGIGAVIVIVGSVLIVGLSPYRLKRLTTFLDPVQDTSGKAYHIYNISLALGSGGLTGVGFGESKQKLRYLPEPQTDSIFAIIAEELGFIISTFLIGALAFLVYRGYYIASRAPDLFGRLVASGITSWIAFQTFINLSSMMHIVPLVGVPLPFISYGGTNLVISLFAMGILLNISRYRVEGESISSNKRSVRRG